MTEGILEQYDQEKHLYSAFTSKMSSLIVEILRENGVRVHSVTHRVKDRESLARKLSRPDCSYANLSDVTDISGVRITTYLEDDVDKVARLIEQEFDVDEQNSGDKGALLDPDRFGYLSSPCCGLSPERCGYALIAQTKDAARILDFLGKSLVGARYMDGLVRRIMETYESLRTAT